MNGGGYGLLANFRLSSGYYRTRSIPKNIILSKGVGGGLGVHSIYVNSLNMNEGALVETNPYKIEG